MEIKKEFEKSMKKTFAGLLNYHVETMLEAYKKLYKKFQKNALEIMVYKEIRFLLDSIVSLHKSLLSLNDPKLYNLILPICYACVECNIKFKNKDEFDEHGMRKHPLKWNTSPYLSNEKNEIDNLMKKFNNNI